jgi:hypothetical protein
MFVEFIFGYLTVIPVFQLEYAHVCKVFDIRFLYLLEVGVGDEIPPYVGLVFNDFPLAFEFVFIHRSILSLKNTVQFSPALGIVLMRCFQVSHSATWHHQVRTLAATVRKRSATRSGVSPLLINASAPAESAAC